MIRVLSRTVRVVVVLVGLGAGVVPLGCKLATKDNPAVCDLDRGDSCPSGMNCVDHVCRPMDTGGGGGKGGATASGGGGGRAALGSGGTAGAAGLGGIGGVDGGVVDGPIDQTDPMDTSVDKPMCTA